MKPDAPAAPDYAAAAEKTAAGNRVNQYTPYGSLTYSPPASGNKDDPWSQNVNLSPVGQQLLNLDNQTKIGLGQLESGGLDYVQKAMQNLPSEANLPARQVNPGQTAQDAIMARLQPTWDIKQNQLANQLANQGIQQGSEAYTNAQRDFSMARNDAESQAALQGIGVGQQARQQGLQEQNYYASEPINMLNAVRTGAQVQNPTFSATPQGANYLQAAGMQGQADLNAYNAQAGSANSMMGGLMGLGGAAMMSPAGTFAPLMKLFSDRRLKSNIVRVGTHPLGIGVYEYDIFGERQRGVMADEVKAVKPDAVSTHASGYEMVDYGAL